MSLPTAVETFGDMLKYLRRRSRLTQRDLAIAVGYTEAHICRLEKNERLPDLATVAALFLPALYLEDEPTLSERLLKLAAQARGRQLSSVTIDEVTIEHQIEQEIGALEDIPDLLPHNVMRTGMVRRVSAALAAERCVTLCGMPGMGKTVLAACVAREFKGGPVFWHTLTAGVNTSVEAIIRQLALFFLVHGQTEVRPMVERRGDATPIPLDQQLMLLRTALTRQPALLCFDEVHWLNDNEPSLSLLRHLSTIKSAYLLLTSRQDVPLPVKQIKLGGLDPDEAQEMIERLGLRLEASVVERLITRTGCSPMLLRLAAGQLVEEHTDVAAFIEHIETQSQVASYLLNTVLRDLSPSAHLLAAFISVFRQPIDLYDEILSELIEKADPSFRLDEALTELRQHHLIDDGRHAALHPLVKDHLYATLAADSRRKKWLHGLAADWLERGLDDIVEAAYHRMCEGDLEQTAEILGDQSERLFNHGQAHVAVQVVELALERAQRRRGDTSSLRRRLLIARGDLLRGTFRAAEAETSYREALALAYNMPAIRAQIVRNLAQILMQRGQAAEGLRLCQSAMADLAPVDTVLRARLASIECRAHLVLSHYDDAEQTAAEAIRLADQFAEIMPQLADDVRARSERTLGWASYTRHPQGAESLVHYQRALLYARRAGLRVVENAVLSNTATALMERGEMDQALQTYQEALKGYEAIGDMYGTAGVLHNLGVVYNNRDELESALTCFEQASEIEQLVGDLEGLLSTEEARAAILLSMGNLAEARAVLDRALAVDKGSTDTWTLGTCLCLLVEVQLLQGELEAARSSVQRVLALPGIQDNARILAWALSGLALVQIAAGEIDAARRSIANTPPDDLGTELTFRWQLVQSAVALAGGDVAGAQSLARLVLEAARQKGFQPAISTAERMLANPDLPVTALLRLILSSNSG